MSLLRKALKEVNEETIGHQRFLSLTGTSPTEWRYYWARWSEVLAEVGASSRGMQQRQDDDTVILCLVPPIRQLGRWPTDQDLRIFSRNNADFPSPNTIRLRGTKFELAARLAELASQDESLKDIRAICEAVGPTPTSKSRPQVVASGFVYLYKAGRDYKIGMSTSPNRRAGEVGTL